MQFIRLQIGCIIFISYITLMYCRSRIRKDRPVKFSLFDEILCISFFAILFDGITAYTVNHLDLVPDVANKILHMLFLLALDGVIFSMFVYILYTTDLFPKRNGTKLFLFVPFIVCCCIVVLFIHRLEFKLGKASNYSAGVSAYTCLIMVSFYSLFSLVVFIKRWHYIEKAKRFSIATYLSVLLIVSIYQMIFPESLVTSIAVVVLVVGIYLNQEDPAIQKLSVYHNEMVYGFSTLIENKDLNTGGHIKRTTKYVQLLAEGLRRRGYYQNILTKDYINNLVLAAPLHDIGKIAVPDAILQKPSKLTSEEFEQIKIHSTKGGEIILNTFGHLENQDYLDVSYHITLSHHEKWSGKGYPNGLKEEEIPLCARIMAIADVFDAISEKRCYRDALPIDQCFEIIEQGKGTDFEPLLVDVFLSMRNEVEGIYYSINHTNRTENEGVAF